MSTDTETLAVYARRASDYAKMTGSDAADVALPPFLAAVPVGGDVLDLGCGPGRTAARMRDLGYNVTATDASPEMIRIAREVHGLHAQVAGFDDLDETAAFDGVLASFSLLHAPKADMPGHLAAIRRALRPGGILTLGLKTGSGEARDGLGRFYAYYSDAEITGVLHSAGFTVTDRLTGADAGLDGTVAPWIVLTAHA